MRRGSRPSCRTSSGDRPELWISSWRRIRRLLAGNPAGPSKIEEPGMTRIEPSIPQVGAVLISALAIALTAQLAANARIQDVESPELETVHPIPGLTAERLGG